MKIDQELLKEMRAKGYICVQKHPVAELYIYNYTQLAQYERMWNDATLMCRGLIMDAAHHVVARPFGKFFNLGEQEHQIIPNEAFEVFEKMDGSLGVMYWVDQKPYIASRGSFTSAQSEKANQLLQEKYAHCIDQLDPSLTYVFEIIYPENRIVVDYGAKEELVLLAIIDTNSGAELPLASIGFPLATKYDGIQDLNVLKSLEEDNKEGFVIKFKSGLRYKVKFAEYVRLHRIITQVSNLTVWEYLKSGQSLEVLLEKVPDEFYNWVRATVQELVQAYQNIEQKAQQQFKLLDNRKDTATYFLSCAYPAVMFRMLDGRHYDDIIWRLIRPTFSKPFSDVES